jgi:hypothetical protein
MEKQPFVDTGAELEMTRQQRAQRFLKRLGWLLGAGLVGTLIYTLLFGPRNVVGFSNGLFIVGALLLVVALMPLVSEIFGRSTISFQSEDKEVDEVLEEQEEQGQQGQNLTFLFGLGGMLMVALSFIVAFL